MDNYHIYEEVGGGKHSVVYKGRRKKTIEYVAVKCVDKAARAKVLHEVRLLRTVDHANVLRFHAWYETTNHLWLILELCPGGDLLSLLMQDGRLPEWTVQSMALDLAAGLQCVHAAAILYCDLKPSNVLVDEYGVLKLCDFGLARRLPESDDADALAGLAASAKRGTPAYLGPEIFEPWGAPSFASDLWSLGCVLHELCTGSPPFASSSFRQLMSAILNDKPPPLAAGTSAPLADLVGALLAKPPDARPDWAALLAHPFWLVPLEPLELPPQPHFARMLAARGERAGAGTGAGAGAGACDGARARGVAAACGSVASLSLIHI